MSHFVFVRHGATAEGRGRLLGRSSGARLSAAGRARIERLAHELPARRIGALYSSPQARAQETAQVIAEVLCRPVEIAAELDEIDYGDWTGRSFEELESAAGWRAFNATRSWARIPNGEFIPDLQARVTGFMERLARLHGDQCVALVSHADVIRAALAYCLGMPLDLALRLDVATGSATVVSLTDHGPRVVCVNYGGALGGDVV